MDLLLIIGIPVICYLGVMFLMSKILPIDYYGDRYID